MSVLFYILSGAAFLMAFVGFFMPKDDIKHDDKLTASYFTVSALFAIAGGVA